MTKLFAILGICLWICLPSTLLSQGGTLTVEGQIINGSLDGGSTADLNLILQQKKSTTYANLEAVTNSEGYFQFDAVEYDATASYSVSVKYQGAIYGIDLDLSTGPPSPISLTVYESTDNADILSVSTASVLFAQTNESNQTISVLEIIRLLNTTDRTYIPGPNPMDLIRFSLPSGAHNLQVDTGLAGTDIIQVDRGFALLASVPPGEHEIMYAYQFPYAEETIPFTKSLSYGAARLRVLAPEEVLILNSIQLGSPETISIGERLYQLLQVTDLPRGSKISVELGGLHQSSLKSRLVQQIRNTRFEYTAHVSLAALMVILVGYALWRRERRKP